MSKLDFISQMVEETIAGDEPVESNVLIFELPKDICQFNVEFHRTRKCFILQKNDKELEIPSNWGPFKNRFSKEFTISKGDDKHMLLPVLSAYFEEDINYAKFSINIAGQMPKSA